MAASQTRSVPVLRAVLVTALLLVVAVAALDGVAHMHPARHETQTPRPIECPHTKPNDCARITAAALDIPISAVRRIRIPNGLEFTSGSFTSLEGVTDEWLTFNDRATGETFLLIFHRSRPRDTLNPTKGRIEASDGWVQRTWVAGRSGRRYLATIISGQVRHYEYAAGGFTYMVRNDPPKMITKDQRDTAIRLLDAVG